MIGMKITLGTESTPEEAIAEFRMRAAEQGFQWVEGSERADYEIAFGEPQEKLVASKIQRTIFTAVATEYMKTTSTPITGKTWVVRADELPKPTWPDTMQVGEWKA